MIIDGLNNDQYAFSYWNHLLKQSIWKQYEKYVSAALIVYQMKIVLQ